MRWVIKAGSQLIRDGGPLLVMDWMRQVAILSQKHEIIWVTSGAIATARERVTKHGAASVSEKQALSAIGQPMIQQLYSLALGTQGKIAAQVLLTYDDIRHAKRSQNLKNSLEQLLSWNAIPILNENDAVSTEEIRFGDNDSLSAKISILTKADRLVLLTDVDGLYERDPKLDASAKVISHVPRVTSVLLKNLKRSSTKSSAGTGGMYSKILAAETATKAGIATHLCRGSHERILLRLFAGEKVGTLIGGKS